MRKARMLRERLGLSMAQVYKATDIDDSQMSKFERGVLNMSLPNLQKLAALYGCLIDDLVAEIADADTEPAAVG